MIRAIFFDVDCTLFSHKMHAIPKSTVDALKKLKAKGIYLFLATGRHIEELKHIDMQGIQFDGYITLNGQLCLDNIGNIVYEQKIIENDLKVLREEFNKKKIPLVFVEKDNLYMNIHTKYAEKNQKIVNLPLPKIRELTNHSIYQVTVFAKKEEVQKLMLRLPNSKCTGWNNFGTDIISNIGGKEQGIAKVIEYFNLEDFEIMAFGDGQNDIDMLEFVDYGIAMGNASIDLKNVADYVTTDVDFDGVARALEHYKLI